MSESIPADMSVDLLTLFTEAVHGRYGVRLAFLDKQRANDPADSLSPSYVLHGTKESLHLVYLVAAEEGERLKALVAEWQRHDTADAFVEFDVIEPDDEEEFRLHDEDAAHLVGGGNFDVVTVDEIEAKLFPVGTEMDADAVSGQTRHDVEIRNGPIKLEFLQKPVRVARAPSKDQSYWAVSPEMPFGDVLAQRFGKHVAHPVKDNWATVFASLIPIKDDAELKKIDSQTKWKTTRKADNGEAWPVKKLPAGYHWATRTKNTVGALYALGIDIDDGTRFEDACAAVEKLDTLALLYTTHSHGSRSLDFSYAKLRTWSEANGTVIEKEDLTTEDVRAFLTAEGKYKPHVIASARFNRWEQTPRGFLVFVDIDPIDKLRIVFLLDKPYDIASFKMEFRDIETQWREIVLGVGKLLDVKPDKAATDLCRLFFEPRHHPNRPDAKIVIYAGGKLLDWAKVERVKEERGGVGGKKASDHYVIGGIDLRIWAKHFAGDFLPTKLMDAHCDDRIRVRQTDAKYTVECPHDQDHSNVGDPNDKGGFVADADDKAFLWGCSHDSCKGRDRDRLDQIKKAIQDGWFPASALFDPDFSNLAEVAFAEALAEFEADNAKAIKRKGKGKSNSGTGSSFAVSLADDGTVLVSDDGRFTVDDHEGRPWYWMEHKAKKDGDEDSESVMVPCCPVFKVQSTAVDAFGGSATITIAYETRHNGARDLTFAKELIYDRQELLKRLSSHLFPMAFEGGVIDLFKLLDFPVDTMLVERTGWHGGAYLHPSGEVTPALECAPIDEDDTDAPEESRGRLTKLRLRGGAVRGDWSRGNLDGWKLGAAICYKDGAVDREQFALGPMMGGAGIVADFLDLDEMPIINFSGKTSHGKSKSAKAAATVCAAPNKRGNFHTLNKTDNSIEAVLSARSGITMIFDEGKTTTPDMLQSIVWKIASKSGKGRSTVGGDARPEKEFSGLVIMTNEIPLAQVLANAGKKQPGGFNVRVLDIDITGAKKLEGSEYVELFGDDIEIHNPGGVIVNEHVPGAIDMMTEIYGPAWKPIVLR